MSEPTESEKYVHLVSRFLVGNGVDIGAGGKPVVPHAIAFDLPPEQYGQYHSGLTPDRVIQWGGDCHKLPFKDSVCDFVFSSHLIEDFLDWNPLLREWVRVIKPGGHLVILLPDKKLWNEAIARGQPPNCAHKHESYVGELSEYARRMGGLQIIEDRLADQFPGDYTIVFVARRM